MEALKVQNQIRNNAEEISTYFSDLAKWEREIKVKDRDIKTGRGVRGRAPVRTRAGAGTVQVDSGPAPVPPPGPAVKLGADSDKGASAAKHTYDVGYKKWENFKECDESPEETDKSNAPSQHAPSASEITSPLNLTPASLAPVSPSVVVQTPIPRARGVASNQDIEVFERERGNEEFKNGNFTAAVNCYTKCLGLKQHNYIAFSNRAMAYLKLHDNDRAEPPCTYESSQMDCTCALRIEPCHTKSLLRRATARNALGKHRAAAADLKAALAVEPTNKQVHQELKKTLDLIKSAVNRAPLVPLTTLWDSGEGEDDGAQISPAEILAGPELPRPGESWTTHKSESGLPISSPTDDNTVPDKALSTVGTDDARLTTAIGVVGSDETSDRDDIVAESISKLVIEETDGDDADICTPSKARVRYENAKGTGNVSSVEAEVSLSKTPSSHDIANAAAIATTSITTGSGSSVNKKSGSKSTSKGSDKKKKKARKNDANERASTSAVYGIERSLLNYRGNDALLANYLSTLDPYVVFPSEKSSILEADVVVDLLLSVSRCYGDMRGNWDTVLSWFAAASSLSSFSFIKSLLSTQQLTALHNALGQCAASVGGDVSGVKAAYGLL